MNEEAGGGRLGDQPSRPRKVEARIWAGFAVAFFIVFALLFLAWNNLDSNLIGGLITIAMAVGLLNHGFWYRDRIMMGGSSLSIILTISLLVMEPALFPIGFIVLGLGQGISGITNGMQIETMVGGFLFMGGILALLSTYISPESDWGVWMVWMILVGLIFITVSRETKNPVTHYLGIFWVLLTSLVYIFRPDLMFPLLGMLFAAGMTVNFIYFYRVLGRTPKLSELFSFASRALFLRGLAKPIHRYGVIVALLRGNMVGKDIIHDVLSRIEPDVTPVILLGPTAPNQLELEQNVKLGWVNTVEGENDPSYQVLPPEDLNGINVFLSKSISSVPGGKTAVIGDFLDNMIPQMDQGTFFRFYSDLVSRSRVGEHTMILVLKADMHPDVEIQMVKRFADVIMESREREERGKLIREVRVSNLADNIETDWERY